MVPNPSSRQYWPRSRIDVRSGFGQTVADLAVGFSLSRLLFSANLSLVLVFTMPRPVSIYATSRTRVCRVEQPTPSMPPPDSSRSRASPSCAGVPKVRSMQGLTPRIVSYRTPSHRNVRSLVDLPATRLPQLAQRSRQVPRPETWRRLGHLGVPRRGHRIP